MRLESTTTDYVLYQVINESTHILASSASYINSIFTNQPNMVINNGMHPLLHQNCHDQIISAQVNSSVFYPPSYKWLAFDYKKVKIDAITFNSKCITSQVELFK